MSVAGSISGALKRFGRPMTLRRLTLGPSGLQVPLDVEVYGTPDGAAVQQLVGTLLEGETGVIISDAEIAAAQWPGPPREHDVMIIDGKTRKVSAPVESKHLGSDVLVHVLKVKG